MLLQKYAHTHTHKQCDSTWSTYPHKSSSGTTTNIHHSYGKKFSPALTINNLQFALKIICFSFQAFIHIFSDLIWLQNVDR